MGIWADMHRRSNGVAHRKEDEPDWWMGIPGIRFVNHGEWFDPELSYNGKYLNYFTVCNYITDLCEERKGREFLYDRINVRNFCRNEAADEIKELFKDGKVY